MTAQASHMKYDKIYIFDLTYTPLLVIKLVTKIHVNMFPCKAGSKRIVEVCKF